MNVTLVVVGGKHEGRKIQIAGSEYTIGRAEGCQLRSGSSHIAPKHCSIISQEGRVIIRDFGSEQGTLLNDKPVEGEHELKNGDRLMIGPLTFDVELSVDVSGKKKPKVQSVQEAAARTVQASASQDDEVDIFGLLGEDPDKGPKRPQITGLRTVEQLREEVTQRSASGSTGGTGLTKKIDPSRNAIDKEGTRSAATDALTAFSKKEDSDKQQ